MMLRDFASLAGWAFLPHYATKFVLEVYYGSVYKFGDKPQPGTPLFVKHYRRVHAALVIGYLMLTIYDAYDQIRKQGDFYQALGLAHDATERQIKSKFRKLAAQHHPDKQIAAAAAASEHIFVGLKIAQDTLLNPVKRFAYDRFGPTMLPWEHCSSIRDYLYAGFQYYSPSYIGAALMTLALGAMGYLDFGKFWRYLGGGSIILLEIYVLTRSEHPKFLTHIINPILSLLPYQKPLLPFQALELARKFALTVSIAISQLGPSSINERGGYNEVDEQRLARLEFLTMMNDMDAARLLRMELMPFEKNNKSLSDLKAGMASWLHSNTVKNDPAVREALTKVVDPGAARIEAEGKEKEKAGKRVLRQRGGEPGSEAEGPLLPESKIYNIIQNEHL